MILPIEVTETSLNGVEHIHLNPSQITIFRPVFDDDGTEFCKIFLTDGREYLLDQSLQQLKDMILANYELCYGDRAGA